MSIGTIECKRNEQNMGRKSRAKRTRAVDDAQACNDEQANGRVWLICAMLCVAVPLLVKLHTLGTLAALPFTILLSYRVFDWLSRRLFDKPFIPPSKYGNNQTVGVSDFVLLVPWVFTFIYLLFMIGRYADWVRGESVWRS